MRSQRRTQSFLRFPASYSGCSCTLHRDAGDILSHTMFRILASSSFPCMIVFIRAVKQVSFSFDISAAVMATVSGSPSTGAGYTTVKSSLRGSGGTYQTFVGRKLAVSPQMAPTVALISRFHATTLLYFPIRSMHSGAESFASTARLGGITMLSLSFNMSEILCSVVVSVRERTETRNTIKVLVNHLLLKLICDDSIQILRSSHSRHSLTYIYIYIYIRSYIQSAVRYSQP